MEKITASQIVRTAQLGDEAFYRALDVDARIAELQSGLDKMMADNSELTVKVHKLEAENERLRGVLSSLTDDTVYSENERLRNALKQISANCSDRHKIMMLGVQAFGIVDQIAKAALRKEG